MAAEMLKKWAQRPQVSFGALALVSLMVLTGCGESRVKVVPVTGKVTFKGQPPAGAQLVLHPVSADKVPENFAATAVVKGDGTFQVAGYEDGDGAPPGDYVATVQWFKLVESGEGAGGRGPNVLPAKYASKDTSPIKITVQDGATTVPPIELN